jgi:hypothetical protein
MQTAMKVACDEIVSRDVGLPAKKLAVGTPVNEFFGVWQSRRPVEPRSKSLPDQHARSSMVPARAFVDLLEYFFAFLRADTLHEYA